MLKPLIMGAALSTLVVFTVAQVTDEPGTYLPAGWQNLGLPEFTQLVTDLSSRRSSVPKNVWDEVGQHAYDRFLGNQTNVAANPWEPTVQLASTVATDLTVGQRR